MPPAISPWLCPMVTSGATPKDRHIAASAGHVGEQRGLDGAGAVIGREVFVEKVFQRGLTEKSLRIRPRTGPLRARNAGTDS